MSQDEIQAMATAKSEGDKIKWEQVRLQAYYTVVAQIGTKDIKKPSDLFKFAWDEIEDKPKSKRLNKEEFLNRAKQIRK